MSAQHSPMPWVSSALPVLGLQCVLPELPLRYLPVLLRLQLLPGCSAPADNRVVLQWQESCQPRRDEDAGRNLDPPCMIRLRFEDQRQAAGRRGHVDLERVAALVLDRLNLLGGLCTLAGLDCWVVLYAPSNC